MNNKQIENNLRTSIENTTPDVLDRIMSEVDGVKQIPVEATQSELAVAYNNGKSGGGNSKSSGGVTNKRKTAVVLLGIIMSIIIVALITLPYFFGGNIAYGTTGYLLLDINPSVQLVLDANGKVSSVLPLNKDAQIMLKGRESEFNNITDADALKKIMNMALDMGYFKGGVCKTNAILLSVNLADTKSQNKLEKKLKKEMENKFKSDGIYGVVITDIKQADVVDSAKNLGITPSKMRLIMEAEALGVVFSDEQKRTISISDIHAAMEDRAEQLEDTLIPDLEDRFDELQDEAEELIENFVDEISDLIEEFEDGLQDEQEDEFEKDLEKLQDILDDLEDKAEDDFKNLDVMFNKLINALDAIKSESIRPTLEDIKSRIVEVLTKFEGLKEGIVQLEKEIADKQKMLSDKYSSLEYDKDDDFDKKYSKWKDDTEEDYEKYWDDLKQLWKNDLD